MPRHFLVKRHKHCGASLSYRDTLQETQDSATDDGNFVTTSTTIIDTDKHIIIRDGDHFSDYSGYSSPDSGYAASPNSAQAGFAREKENVGTDRENNNNKNFNKVANGVGFYDSSHHASVKNPHPHHHHHSSSSSSGGGRDSHSHSNSINDINREDHYMMVDPPDAPIDLSMPSRKKNVLSSVPAYLQQENHRHHHHHHHHQIKSQQQQQQQQQQHQRQLYHRPPSPVHSATVSAAAAAAAVAYFSSFNNFYLSDKTDRSLCHAVVPPLSPSHPAYNPPLPLPLHLPRQDSRPSGLYPSTIKTDVSLETSAAAAHSEILSRPQCISVPTASSGQKLSSSSSAAPSISSSSSPQPPMVAREQVTAPVPGRLTPLKTPSPLHSPNRKRVISEDHEELSNGCYPHDLSKSAPVLKKSDSSLTAVTPASKGTSSSTQSKAKTAAPAVKKSQSSTPSGKKLRAVRRLNFDIDTTSPVSGTIIKDAADFHPEEGKVVYGDIEPSFNFVEVTPEARAELERIENKIGDYICQLCKEFFEDAFQLAQHRCSRIVHVEYRCPECEKVFNCPANLASHRRWHKPRTNAQTKGNGQGAGKLLSANPKIAPKPDCNGNSMTGTTFSATAATSTLTQALTSTSVTSGRDDCVNDELASVDAGKNGVQTSEPLTSVKSLEGDISANNTKDNEAVSVGPGLQAHPFRNESNSEPHSNEKDSSVIVGGSKSSADEEHTSGDSEFQTYSLSQNDSYLRPSTVIATNPLHTTTFGSTLTAEERSLVLQVLNSHHRQHQTTTITSTTTVMTPLVSDTHCNIMMDPENRPYLTGERAIQNDTADVIRPVQRHDDRVCMDTSVSPLPLDLTNASDQHKQKDLSQQQKFHPQQQQQQQHQIGALSERQGNPQIECSLCGKRFQRQAYLRKHMHSQHNKQNNVIKTADINIDANTKGKTMDNGVNINSDHHATIDTTTTTNCGVCSKGFSSESARLKHEAVIHGLTPHLTCSACGMTFTSKAALDKHTRSAHAAETYACKYCASSFHSSPGLTRHINKCHPTENRQVILLQLPASRTC